jgi:hypothetical protein
MSEVCFNVSGHKIQLILSLSAKESIVHDNKTISEKGSSLAPTSNHSFKVSEDGKCQAMKWFSKPSFRV